MGGEGLGVCIPVGVEMCLYVVCLWEGRMGDTDGVLGAGRGNCDADIIIGLSCPSLILAHSSIEDGSRNICICDILFSLGKS